MHLTRVVPSMEGLGLTAELRKLGQVLLQTIVPLQQLRLLKQRLKVKHVYWILLLVGPRGEALNDDSRAWLNWARLEV